MRILMLGWEFPPFISGGLGTACRGLTDGLKRANTRVLFVLPRSIDTAAVPGASVADRGALAGEARYAGRGRRRLDRVIVAAVSSALTDPYLSSRAREADAGEDVSLTPSSLRVTGVGAGDGYDGDLLAKIQAYAQRCVQLARRELFDVIHAHDWMTYPAAMAISQLSGRPMVAHVHATEFDRSSDPTGIIQDIERRGVHAAARVLAVSQRTKDIVVDSYGVRAGNVTVVHNGIDPSPASARRAEERHPTVLFLGRITRQKGPRFFIQAAARVARRLPEARFVVAGDGDQLGETVALAHELGIADRVEFPGFLRGDDVNRAYDRASVYVMPSVSEPFGLTALEAAARGVPVILSTTSGAAEVLRSGSLQVDYWDVDSMARLVVAVLTNPGLAQALVRESRRELAGANWDTAARSCVEVYYQVTTAAAFEPVEGVLAGVDA
jgi:glycosyltransferase involved in cell wall biosynthesis